MIPTRPQRPPRTPLARLVGLLQQTAGDAAPEVRTSRVTDDRVITGVTMDSRSVQPGDLFVAPAGSVTHGASFAAAAVAAGAAAVLTDAVGAALCGDLDVPVVVVPAPRQVVGLLAAEVYGHPASALRLLAVTGTHGKTTTTLLAEGALRSCGVTAGVIGTVGTRIAGEEVKTALTTPEAPELHALLATMRERDVAACAMEVSSHAIVMGRVDGVVFDVAAFTNLGRDHLDFHADMEDYFAAKAALFTPLRARSGLVNVDDRYGRRLVEEATIPVRTFSCTGRTADWQAAEIRPTGHGSRFTVSGPAGELDAETLLPGGFNVSNALCAIAGAAELGFDAAAVAVGLGTVGGVPGRLEAIDAGQDFLAVVDYAHKPDAVEAVLRSLRERTDGGLVVVLGAGGDRDRGKRPLMGEVAGRLADVLVVTDDNPRGEDPAEIRGELLAGARKGAARVEEVGDRRAAIRRAVTLTDPRGTLAVLGKGHETGQEVGGEVLPFDDRDELRRALAELSQGGAR